MTAIAQDTDDPPSTRRHPLLTAARVLLFLLWVGWAALSWWSAPRPSTVAQLRADADAGRVTGFTRAGDWRGDQRLWASTAAPASINDKGLLIVWHTTSGRVRYVEPDGDRYAHPPVFHGGVANPDDPNAAPRTTALAAELRAAGVPDRVGTPGRLGATAPYLGYLICGTGLILLLFGPAPARGTGFYWFWVGLIPLGLGALAWLAFERPWSRRAELLGPTGPGGEKRPRMNGFTGFGVLVVASIAVAGCAAVLHNLLGPGPIPWPPLGSGF